MTDDEASEIVAGRTDVCLLAYHDVRGWNYCAGTLTPGALAALGAKLSLHATMMGLRQELQDFAKTSLLGRVGTEDDL